MNPVLPKFEAIDPVFEVKETAIAQLLLKDVLNGMQGLKTFGTGWKTVYRRYPAVKMEDKYLLLYDLGQS